MDDRLITETAVGAGDDDYFAHEIGDVCLWVIGRVEHRNWCLPDRRTGRKNTRKLWKSLCAQQPCIIIAGFMDLRDVGRDTLSRV
jgi:hypothetical protein